MDRRTFFGSVFGASALCLHALKEANAAIYDDIKALNDRFQNSPDGAYWDAVRKHFHLENDLVMMNNGTVGPVPIPVFNTLVEAFEVQVKAPCDCYTYLPQKAGEVRPKLADFIGAFPDEVAITQNTTEGMSFVANGLDLKEGDEVIMSTMEHPAGIHPWGLKAKRHGIRIKEVRLNLPSKSVEEVVDGFEKAITPRTKVISLSHTVYKSGLIAPIREIGEMAHRHDVLVLADGAHAIGMLELNMKELGVDFWCSSPYKWLGAPAGVGAFYVRREVQDRLWPTIVSTGWDTEKSAVRFETLGQRADALTIALGEALDFQNHIGRERIARRIRTLASHLKEELSKIPGVKLHTSQDPYLSAGLTCFSVSGTEPQHLVDYLREKYNIVIRTVGREGEDTYGVRVSTNIFVSLKDVHLLIEGVKEVTARA